MQVIIEDEATGARLAPELRSMGWTVDHDVVMTWERQPDRPADVAAEVVPWEAIRPVIVRHTAALHRRMDLEKADVEPFTIDVEAERPHGTIIQLDNPQVLRIEVVVEVPRLKASSRPQTAPT